MRTKGLYLLVLSCIICHETSVRAQTYPASLQTNLTGAASVFLDEYSDPFKPGIRTTIHFTDFTESSWRFALRLRITGPAGIRISTKPGSRPVVPAMVSPGQPYVMEGADLDFYFNYNNLVFQGISKSQLELNHKLPEGMYTFCFEAVDYESGRVLSHPACAGAYLALHDPPIILSPAPGSVAENVSLQNILFQWQLSNASGNIDLSKISYQIDLYEVNNNWANPVTAILNNQALPVWQSFPQQQTTFLYTNIEPALERGKRYVFTVRATEENGRGRFKNEGYSVPCFFRYGYEENDTLLLSRPAEDFQYTLSTPSRFEWTKPPKAQFAQMISYNLRIVELDSLQNAEDGMMFNPPFFQQTYLATSAEEMAKTIPVSIWANISRMGRYAWQVKAESGMQEVAQSEIRSFTGPPAIENFIAGGFLMEVTKLKRWDKGNNLIVGQCRTALGSGWDKTEFAYDSVYISSIGNNEWVMSGGSIADRISVPDHTLTPQAVPENREAFFSADSIYVDPTGLNLAGVISWNMVHLNSTAEHEQINTKRVRLSLASQGYRLNGAAPVTLASGYDIALLEPYRFGLRINQNSVFSVQQSKYTALFNGFVRLPPMVQTVAGTAANIAFSASDQLFYLVEENNMSSESIALSPNASFELQPVTYTIDLSQAETPETHAGGALWKGVVVKRSLLTVPGLADVSGQIRFPVPTTYTIDYAGPDSNEVSADHSGLRLYATVPLPKSDSMRFNGFISDAGTFHAEVEESSIKKSYITGRIQIPVIDTAATFPYYIDLDDFGFGEGYLVNGLAGTTFTFNASGSFEQRVVMTIRRALFRGRNRLEMDLDAKWPHFGLELMNLQRFCAWGNNNIGFDIPNGKFELNYQAKGKSGYYDITVDQVGCGRNGNVYAFGASAKINLDEDISGDNGPPVVNAYSIGKNPLLTGTLNVALSVLQSSVSGSTVTTVSTGSSTAGTTAAASYSGAVTIGIGDALQELGFQSSDTVSTLPFENENVRPLVGGNMVTEVINAIDILYRLKPFIRDEDITDSEWQLLDRLKQVLQNDVVMQTQVTNAKGLLNYVLSKVVDGLADELGGRIDQVGEIAVSKIRSAISTGIEAPVNQKIDEVLVTAINNIQRQVLQQVNEEHHQAVISAFAVLRQNMSEGIRNSVTQSIGKNITSKVEDFIRLCVVSKVRTYVRDEVRKAGQELISKGKDADLGLRQIYLNGRSMFADVADTVRDVFMHFTAHHFVRVAQDLVEDAVEGVDWQKIATGITADLVSRGLSQALANQVSVIFSEDIATYVTAALSVVKFDFNNLGEKLQNGQLDKIVKLDPTNIYIQSSAVDVKGTLVFTKDDPLFGDSWQANVLVRVKVVKKENPVECSAFFLSGKASNQNGGHTFWFAKAAVSGLDVPLKPTPMSWDGVDGFFYKRMRKTEATVVVPDGSKNFGVGCHFTFRDAETNGATIILALGLEAEFAGGGFSTQFTGDVSLLNYLKVGGKHRAPGLITGYGTAGYYKTPEVQKVAGSFDVQLNTQPVLCAGGQAGFDFRTLNNWKAWVGTQQNPFAVKLLCKNFLQQTAYIQVSNTGFGIGIGANANLFAQSPWINLNAIKVRGSAAFSLGYNVYAGLAWQPSFVISEASVNAWANAAISVEYETAVNTGSLTLAGVSLAGNLTYKSQPQAELHGQMNGNITVAGYNIGFQTPVHYSLSQQKILD